METPIRIGVLISGGGSNLQAIFEACDAGAIDGRVVFVGSDNPAAGGLERARSRGVATFVVDYGAILSGEEPDGPVPRPPEDFDLEEVVAKLAAGTGCERAPLEAFAVSRAPAEALLLDRMKAHGFDLLVLAGFMRKLTPYFIDRVNVDAGRPRIMNIHPSLLPAFPGVDGYGDTFRYGCKVGGCTVHFVDYGEDTGPIIGQRCFSISDGDTLKEVRSRGLKEEWKLYPECIRLFAQGRLKLRRPGRGRTLVCRS